MRFPARLSHLATRAVVTSKLAPTYGEANQVEDDEAAARLYKALSGPLLEDLLAAAWTELWASAKKQEEDVVLEKVARGLKDRPQRPGKLATVTPAWSAFMVTVDVHAGIATDSARRLLETPQGAKAAADGLAAAGKHLAAELVRK